MISVHSQRVEENVTSSLQLMQAHTLFFSEHKTFYLVLISFAVWLKNTERASLSKALAARHSSRCTKSYTNVLDMDDKKELMYSHILITLKQDIISPNTHKFSKIVPLPS